MSDLKTSEVLDKAADLLQGNWTQGDWKTFSGKMCLEGGILAATGQTWSDIRENEGWLDFMDCPSYQAVVEYLQNSGDLRVSRELWRWNDRDERTEEQVIAALRGAAEQERQKEQQGE